MLPPITFAASPRPGKPTTPPSTVSARSRPKNFGLTRERVWCMSRGLVEGEEAMSHARKSANGSNGTAALLEAVRSDVEKVAEGVSGLSDRFTAFEKRLASVEGDIQFMKPIVHSLAPVPKDLELLKKDVGILKTDVKELKDRLTTIETR